MKLKSKFSRNILLISFFSFFCFSACKKEETQLQPANLKGPKHLAATTAPVGAYNIVNSLPAGYVKDGTRDYTAYIQKALDNYTNIVFPGFPILVNDEGLKVRSNTTITFLNGSLIKLKPTAWGRYSIFYIYHVSNVTLIDPVIEGDRTKHLGTIDPYGSGIVISSSTQVTIKNPTVSECWGDGIHIRQPENDPIVPRDIVVENARLIKNRRNGISVISGINVRLTNTYVYGVLESEGGVRAMSGIDLEPINGTNEMRMININVCKTEHMGAEGIQVRLKRLYGAKNKYVSININRHEDIGAPLAGLLFEIKNLNGDPAISGFLNVYNCVWRKNTRYVTYGLGWSESNIKVNMNTPKISDVNDKFLSDTQTKSLIAKFMHPVASYSIVQ